MSQDVATLPPVTQLDTAASIRRRGEDSRRGLFPTLLLLFFSTGACGLIYQQLWVRVLSLP